jgi:transposase
MEEIIRNRIRARLTGFGVSDPDVCAHLLMSIPEIQGLIDTDQRLRELMAHLDQEACIR